MIIHIFSEEKFELIKRKYMDLEVRFNRLAGSIEGYRDDEQQDPATDENREREYTEAEGDCEIEKGKDVRSDCRESIFCLDYAYLLINRMGCGYGDLTMHMSRCHETLKDLEKIVLRYENKIQPSQSPEMPGFKNLDGYLNLERDIAIFPDQIEAIGQYIVDSGKKGKKPQEALNDMLDLDPEQIRMILEMVEEDMLIKSEVQAISSQQKENQEKAGVL